MVEERKHDAINNLDRPFLKDVSYDSNKAAVSLFKDIKAEEFAKNILSIDPKIRFAGLIERSGYLFAGGFREGVNHYLKRSNAELSLSQSAHIVYLRERFLTELGNLKYIVYYYDKVKLFSMPVKQHILVFSTESTASTEDVASKVSQYIKSMEHQLSLHPPSNIINKEKKETLRNLYESGFEEEVIADQLDLDLNTVRMLIKELYN
jgi:Family of unknown function (DUF6659)